MKKSHSYEINHIANTVIITKKFYEASTQLGTDESDLMQQFKAMGLSILIQQRKQRESKATEKELKRHITYQMMEGYISRTDKSEELMEEFNIMKGLAKESDPKHAHALVLEWFHENCPNYGKVPKFNSEHKVIAKDDTETKTVAKIAA